MNNLAPIVLFVYNRPEHTKKTLDALSENYFAKQSVLYVFADGPKSDISLKELEQIQQTRQIIKENNSFKSIIFKESTTNLGLYESIINGVTLIINEHKKIIVLEDDIITSKGFLKYMNDALNIYKDEEQVMSISGFMWPIKTKTNTTYFIKGGVSAWGWGTWQRAWGNIELDINKLLQSDCWTRRGIKEFNFDNGYDYYSLLKNEKNAPNKKSSWAIRWYASVFIKNGYGLMPGESLVNNIGFDNSGVHCDINNKFYHKNLCNSINVEKQEIKENIKIRGEISNFFNSDRNVLIKRFFNRLHRKQEYIMYELKQNVLNLNDLAPIVLFVYNRPDHARKTLEALSQNILANQSSLYIFCDGPKENATIDELKEIEITRMVVKEKKWCKNVTIINSEVNLGIYHSIVPGVTQILNKFGKIIVLEDDIVTSKGFLTFMNEVLEIYKNEERVMCVSGYFWPLKKRDPKTIYFIKGGTSAWGWGTWQRAWKHYESDLNKLINNDFWNKSNVEEFNYNNSFKYFEMLRNELKLEVKKANWDIRWYATVFINGGYGIYPSESLVNNICFDNSGVHCKANNKYLHKELCESLILEKQEIKENKKIREEISKYFKSDKNILIKRLLKWTLTRKKSNM